MYLKGFSIFLGILQLLQICFYIFKNSFFTNKQILDKMHKATLFLYSYKMSLKVNGFISNRVNTLFVQLFYMGFVRRLIVEIRLDLVYTEHKYS